MKKEKFSFAKWLTSRDVEKIVSSLGLELMTKDNNPDKKRIMKFKDDEGYHIVAFCKDLNKAKEYAEISKILMKSPALKNLSLMMATTFATLDGASQNSHSFFELNNMVVLKFDDFFLQETLSLKDEKEEIEYDRYLTKTYQKYMSQKFGKFYNSMKSAHYKKLYKQIREEEKNQEVEESL